MNRIVISEEREAGRKARSIAGTANLPFDCDGSIDPADRKLLNQIVVSRAGLTEAPATRQK
jgi:hypothetical protein